MKTIKKLLIFTLIAANTFAANASSDDAGARTEHPIKRSHVGIYLESLRKAGLVEFSIDEMLEPLTPHEERLIQVDRRLRQFAAQEAIHRWASGLATTASDSIYDHTQANILFMTKTRTETGLELNTLKGQRELELALLKSAPHDIFRSAVQSISATRPTERNITLIEGQIQRSMALTQAARSAARAKKSQEARRAQEARSTADAENAKRAKAAAIARNIARDNARMNELD